MLIHRKKVVDYYSFNVLEESLKLAAKGYQLFPVRAGTKMPACKNGMNAATTDQSTIKSWWQFNPYDNVGINCKNSGIVVIDADYDPARGLNGIETLQKLIAELGELPITVTVQTPRGGYHFWFKAPEGALFKGKISPDVDIKHNGSVLVPPSAVGDRYGYLQGLPPFEIEPAELSEIWLDYMKKDIVSSQKTCRQVNYKNTDVNFQKIVETCNFIRYCIQYAPIISYHEWFAFASIMAQIRNGRELFHQFSSPHPKYNPNETDRLFNSCHNFGKPQTCKYINSISNACTACRKAKR